MIKNKNPKWTREEALILFDSYIQVMQGHISKEEAVKIVSLKLRKMAMDSGIQIDDTFRNEDGISMQFENINYIVTDGEYGLSNASELFKNLIADYIEILRK